MQIFSADATIFKKRKIKKNCPPKRKKVPKKVAHNPIRQTVFSLASFCFVQLRPFYSLKLSHLWSCQTLQDAGKIQMLH